MTDAFNAEDPIPPGASSEGTGQFFIYDKEILRTIVAVGGENIAGVWDQCETECTDGVALLDAGFELTWANFQEVAAPGVVQVFRTSSTYQPDFGGLAGGDDICQERAEEVGLNGTWTAWLSDDNTNARDRIPDGRYELVNGTVIADNKADLTDGELKAAIILNQFGAPDEDDVWTGTQPDGTHTASNCSNWTNADDEDEDSVADDGNSERMDTFWTNDGTPNVCFREGALYCFGGGQ